MRRESAIAEAWTLIVPIKNPVNGKTRLRCSLRSTPWADDRERLSEDIADTLARDCLSAICDASSVSRVLLVTDDPDWTQGLPVEVLIQASPGLDGALGDALRSVTGHTGIIVGDLPGLRSEDLDEALAIAATFPLGMISDACGTGTTMVTSLDAADHRPQFGTDSAARHHSLGYRELDVPHDSGLRHDLDMIRDLLPIEWSQLGTMTRTLLRREGLPTPLSVASRTAPPSPSHELRAAL